MDGHMMGSASTAGIVGTIQVAPECTDLTDQVHQLPCCIKYNGQCSVSDYFKPKITGVVADELELKEAAFRGRKLAGATLPIPETYRGFVLEKEKPGQEQSYAKSSTFKEQSVDSWNAIGAFQNITYWNHDTVPSKTDMFNSSFDWFTVGNAMHKHVMAAEVASAIHEHEINSEPTGVEADYHPWVACLLECVLIQMETSVFSGTTCGQKRKSDRRS